MGFPAAAAGADNAHDRSFHGRSGGHVPKPRIPTPPHAGSPAPAPSPGPVPTPSTPPGAIGTAPIATPTPSPSLTPHAAPGPRIFRSEPPLALPAAIAWASRDEILVAIRAGAGGSAIEPLAAAYDLSVGQEVPLPSVGLKLSVLRVPNASLRDVIIDRLNADGRVVAAQPNYRYRTLASEAAPAPAPRQYAVEAIHADAAHAFATGRGVLVGVIDTRVDANHPALKGRILEAIDLTGRGEADPGRHGTGLAGVMAAQATRATIEGIAPGARILAIQAFEPDPADPMTGLGSSQKLAQAIDIAVKYGVRLLNLSFSGPRDPIVSFLLQRAIAAGIVVVAAAGNDGPEGPPRYPAAQDGVIAVTATDAVGRLYTMATHGPFVSVAAPGVDILTLGPGDTLQYLSGTSLAAAHVTAVVALMLETAPAAAPVDIKQTLERSARANSASPTRSDGYGAGRVDALQAVMLLGPRLAKSLKTD